MGNYKSKKDNKNDKNNRDKDNINKGHIVNLYMVEPKQECIEIMDDETINQLIVKSLDKIEQIYCYDIKLYFGDIIKDKNSRIKDV